MVCVQFGIVSVEYFLDKMQFYELNIICDSLHLRQKDNWEQARLVAYIIAQVNSKKRLKPTDIIKFGWEDKINKPQEQTMTLNDVERIKQMAAEREKILKEKGII